MNELKNIMTINMNNSTRNEIGEHHRYDEVIGYILLNSNIITKDIINNFLDE